MSSNYINCQKCGMKYHVNAQKCPMCKCVPEQFRKKKAKKKANQEDTTAKFQEDLLRISRKWKVDRVDLAD